MSGTGEKKIRVHVIKRESEWAVKKEGAQKASKIYATKAEAVKNAQKLKRKGHDIVIHRPDGSIERWQES
jgi:hypothetical protein